MKDIEKSDGAEKPVKGFRKSDGTEEPVKDFRKSDGAEEPVKDFRKSDGAEEPVKGFRKREGIEVLVQAGNRADRHRNQILTLAVGLAIFVLFCVFSIAKGKVVVDSIKNMRQNGSAASAYLENGKEAQYEKLKSLDYIDYVGQEHEVGEWNREGEALAVCEVVDKTGFEKMLRPAYDGMKGRYPEAENEIMLPKTLLLRLGILKPQLGMKIAVPIQFGSWSVNGGNELTEEFVLSGYYSDYMDETEHVPAAYLSEKYLGAKKIPRYPQRLLLVFKSGFLSHVEAEKQLYRDVPLTDDNQQFVGSDSADFQAVNQFIGGSGAAVLCSVIILLSVYLLIYNVLSISLNKDIRYYGLLFTVGLTRKQVRDLMFRQSRAILMKGISGGIAASLLVGIVGFPVLFRGLFLQQRGKIGIGTVLYPGLLFGAVLIVTAVMLLAVRHTMQKFKKLSPIETFRYREVTVSCRRKSKWSIFRTDGKV